VVAINHAVRQPDEWFDEPDDLDRVRKALEATEGIQDPIRAAATAAYRITRAQGFGEANKRTAFLAAKWILDHNGVDGGHLIPAGDRTFADLLIKASTGRDVERDILRLLRQRSLERGRDRGQERGRARAAPSVGREPFTR
jgi:prophage maintenance system killer protein